MQFSNEHIWIIGASSGIGKALAEKLSQEGATLILSSRRQDELETLQSSLGEQHRIYPLDVADSQQVKETTQTLFKQFNKIDRIIFMAAIYRPDGIEQLDMSFAQQLVHVNLLGAIYITYAILPLLEQQTKAQIALCASVAGYTGLPSGQPYSATKAALINFSESLYAEVAEHIDIKVINPGFVRTRITDKNKFHMPMRIEPEAAAEAIAKGLKKKAFEIHFPKRFTYCVKLLSHFPYFIKLWITKKLK